MFLKILSNENRGGSNVISIEGLGTFKGSLTREFYVHLRRYSNVKVQGLHHILNTLLHPILNILLLLSHPENLAVSILSSAPLLLLYYHNYLAASIPILNSYCLFPILNILLLLSYLNYLDSTILPWIACCFFPILKTLLLLSYPEYLAAYSYHEYLLSLLPCWHVPCCF